MTEDGTAFSMRYLWVIGGQRLREMVSFLTMLENYLAERRFHKEPCSQECSGGSRCHCGVCVFVNEEMGLGGETLPKCPHFHLSFTSVLLLFGAGIVSSLISSILICVSYSLAKGKGNGKGNKGCCGLSFLLNKPRTRTVCLSIGVILLLLAWTSLAFVLASVLYPVGEVVYELAIARVGPDELKTSDHMMVQSSFFFPEI